MKLCCTKIATLFNKKTENYPFNIHSYHYDQKSGVTSSIDCDQKVEENT